MLLGPAHRSPILTMSTIARNTQSGDDQRMKFVLCLLVSLLAVGAETKKKQPLKRKTTTVSRANGNNCVDLPRVAARKRLDASQLLGREMDGVLVGLGVSDALQLNLEMEAPTEKSAEQLEKMVGVLVAAQKLKARPGEVVAIDLPNAARVQKSGKTVVTTISLTDAQLEKLLEARYGRKLVSEARGRFIYVHGLSGGTRTIPFN